MFKNVMLYRLGPEELPTVEAMEAALACMPFQPCGPSQEKSMGWVAPRGEKHAALVESIGGQRILRFMLETKGVPGSVVQRHLDERLAHIQAQEGRQPGRKECRELREHIVHELLPMAFAKTSSVMVWLDMAQQRLVLDTSSPAKADAVLSALVKTLPSFSAQPWNTQLSPQAAMTAWLTGPSDGWPAHFAPGHEVELKSSDDMKSVVKFTRHPLDDEQMRLHISQGKLPSKLALDWDGRVSLVLHESTVLSKVSFLDGVFDDAASAEEQSGFDANVAIATAELSSLITDLSAALGGPA